MTSFYNNIIKRLADAGAALLLLIVFSPVMLLVALLLKLTHHQRLIFVQPRTGKDETTFLLYKFCSMTEDKDANGNLLPDADRLTSLGKWIRKTSLDELPQLLNVLKGDMSLVGPRPLLPRYLEHYSDEQRRRHLVRPGITGWAQVNGRNAISWTKKFELDQWYVHHQGFWLDVRILWMTATKLFKNGDVNKEGHATTELFTGNN